MLLSSKRMQVASSSMNFESALNGESARRFASSKTSLAAQVLPMPGGPYISTCCGFGPHIAARSARMPSCWPTMSSMRVGRAFSLSGIFSDFARIALSCLSSAFSSRARSVGRRFIVPSAFARREDTNHHTKPNIAACTAIHIAISICCFARLSPRM